MSNHSLPHLPHVDFQTLRPAEIADYIEKVPYTQRLAVFGILAPHIAVATFELLPFDAQKEILYSLSPEHAAGILNAMSPDDRTAFLAELPSATVNNLLKLLSPSERSITLQLLGYPENSVGRLMTPDYIAVHMDWTVQHVLKHIRIWGHRSETIDVIYVIDDNRHLLDDLHIREFLVAPPQKRVSELADHRFVALHADENQEAAVHVFQKNDRVALPVIDNDGILLGIVTLDDILNVVNEEFTKDIQQVGGLVALDEPYMKTPFLRLMKKRGGWLIILFLGEMLTATAMTHFEDVLARAVVLSLFLPLIISSGGNSGSQASTLIIRALALGEITVGDWWKIGAREIASGLFLGTLLGLVGFLRVCIWSQFTPVYGPHWLLIATTICFSLIGVVLWGSLMGAMLPLILKYIGVDPATSSSPFVATLVDVTGIIIYFSIAVLFLSGTLL